MNGGYKWEINCLLNMTINELKKRSNKFVANIDVHVADVVENNPKLLDINRAQLRDSKTALGGALVNSITGSELYSPGWARYKGYNVPDLFDTGNFYRAMTIDREARIFSEVDYTKHLIKMYGFDIFGIGDKEKAQNIISKILGNRYRLLVL